MEFLKHAPRSALHVSVSQVRSYLGCPQRFNYRYLLGAEPEHRHPNLVLGSAVHEALAEFYLSIKSGQMPEAERITAKYEDAFGMAAEEGPAILLEDGEKLEEVQAQGLALVQAFLANVVQPAEVLAVERGFSCDLVDPSSGEILEEQLVGTFDAVVADSDGTLVVLEHKTAARAWSADQLEYDLQVSLYQAVAGADTVRLQVLTKTKVAKMLVHDLKRQEKAQIEAVDVVCKVLTAIRAGAFWRQRGWQCRECEFRMRCAG